VLVIKGRTRLKLKGIVSLLNQVKRIKDLNFVVILLRCVCVNNKQMTVELS
jgi:hypothetical protein